MSKRRRRFAELEAFQTRVSQYVNERLHWWKTKLADVQANGAGPIDPLVAQVVITGAIDELTSVKARFTSGPTSITTTENPPMPSVVWEVEEWSFNAWRPSVDDSMPCEQVHLIFKMKGEAPPLVVRFKTRQRLEEHIAVAAQYADEVWPDEEPL